MQNNLNTTTSMCIKYTYIHKEIEHLEGLSCTDLCSNCFVYSLYIYGIFTETYDVGNIIISILQIRKLKHGEIASTKSLS